nr:hypothetical protein L321_22962 [Pseudomonas plecoglossicida NB2011]
MVAARFADRPRLRSVLARVAFEAIVERYPWTRENHPLLQSAQGLTILHAAVGNQPAQQSGLVDTLLAHFLNGRDMALTPSDQLSLTPPQVFRPQDHNPAIDLDMDVLNQVFNDRLSTLSEAFGQAQISFWSGSSASAEVSPLRWIEQLLKAALLDSIERQGLSGADKALLYGLVKATDGSAGVHALQVSLNDAPLVLADLLIIAPSVNRQRLLWCTPGGSVRGFDTQADFASALRNTLADRYAFDRLAWTHTALQTPAFAYQARQLLNAVLQRLARIQRGALDDVAALEAAFDQLSDPSLAFPDCSRPLSQAPDIPLPQWLSDSDPTDRFQYQSALLGLAANQAAVQGTSSMDDIESLQQYTARRLREQMQADHPGRPLPDPDRLLISISQRVQVSSSGPWELQFVRAISLTELAISRLQPSSQEVASAFHGMDEEAFETWMNLEYLNSLIQSVDVGGRYPHYVHAQLLDLTTLATRTRRFAEEWRSALLFSALEAKIQGHLDERSWQALADVCGGAPHSPIRLAPLAFRRVRGFPGSDQAHGMYLIELPATRSWVLYRPLIVEQTVLEFASLDQLMQGIRATGDLQRSILTWLDDDARPVYDNDGFNRPHLHPGMTELAALLGPGAIMTYEALERLRLPVELAVRPWSGDLDAHLYNDKAQTLILLASRQSLSNAQQRWAVVVQCTWLAFNTVTVLLRGPAATLVWLAVTLFSLKNDLATLTHGSTEERVLATTDLLLNLAMLLAHGPQVADPAPISAERPVLRSVGPAAPPRPATLSISLWSNDQRLGNLPSEARAALVELRATTRLDGHAAQASGRLRGLFKVDERYYVKLQDVAYEVEESWNGIRILGPDTSKGEWVEQGGQPDGYRIIGRERRMGPWITRWNGEWMIDLSLAGGMPRTRQSVREDNFKAFAELQAARTRNDETLLKHEKIIDSNLDAIKPYDESSKALRAILKEYPDIAREALPDAVQTRMTALHGLRKALRDRFLILALTYEKQAEVLASQVDLFARMSEVRFRRFDPSSKAAYAHGQWWEMLLNSDVQAFHRLLDMTDYPLLQEQSRALIKLPFGDEQARLSLAFRDNLKTALAAHKRILSVSLRLDRNLSKALQDSRIQFENKVAKIEKIIAQRNYSTVITSAQVLSDLTQLLIKRDLLTAESFDELLRLQADLRNRDFQEAMLSHDGLAAADLPLAEQVDILNNALREYQTSLGKACFLLVLNDPAVDDACVTDYIHELSALKGMAERDLSRALHDSETGAVVPRKQATYRVPGGKRKLIRTTHGKTILAEQQQDDTHAVQHDPVTDQPVTQYRLDGERWQYVTPTATPRGSAYLHRIGEGLLARQDAKVALASRYSDEPNSLADLMDWHIEDMLDIAQQLRAGPPADQPLAARLEQAMAGMQAEKRRLLTDAYFGTRHPDSKALRYLFDEGQIEIGLARSRKRLRADDYLDVYTVNRIQPRQPLWEAHFHYTNAQDNPRAFAKGHLKLCEPRSMSRDEQLQRSLDPAEQIRIYRGDLRLGQIEGLIPFPAE